MSRSVSRVRIQKALVVQEYSLARKERESLESRTLFIVLTTQRLSDRMKMIGGGALTRCLRVQTSAKNSDSPVVV